MPNDRIKPTSPPQPEPPEPETEEQREARVEREFQKKVAKLTEHTRDNGVRLIALELDGLRLATIAQSKNLGKWAGLIVRAIAEAQGLSPEKQKELAGKLDASANPLQDAVDKNQPST